MSQNHQKTSAGLKKALDLAPLYIESNGCNRSLRETLIQNGISGKKFSPNVCSPTGFSKDCMIISSMFASQEDGCVSQSLKENGNDGPYRQMTKAVKSTYTKGDSRLHNVTQRTNGNSDGVTSPLRVSVEERQARSAPGNANNGTPSTTNGTPSTPSPMTPDSFHESLSDSCSNRSSTDSLPGPQNSSAPPNGLEESEPIYAESTKRKRRMPCDGKESETELNASDAQRATITVVAAHTEENNRTFYLSSPDSAVSTQWTHFSPTAPKDSSSPAFTWPDAAEATPSASQPKPQSSPPVPPKTNSRPPRLGTSSLSLPLPEISFNVVPPKDVLLPVPSHVDSTAPVRSAPVRKHRSMEGCIDEVEEEGESERSGSCTRPVESINGPAVRGFVSREWKSESSATPGTGNKSSSQTPAGVPEENGNASESTRAHLNQTSQPNASRDPVPPPPPPKKHHR